METKEITEKDKVIEGQRKTITVLQKENIRLRVELRKKDKSK